MTATPDKIPSDLTMEIGENLSPDRFMAAARAFFGYVNEIGQMLAPEGEAPRWTVRVKEGSALLAVEPTSAAAPAIVQSVYSKVEAGIRTIATGDIEEAGLSEPALKHLRVLAELSEGPRHRPIDPIRIWVRRKPVDVDVGIARTIKEDWRIAYNDYGTVEGRLESIQDRDGSLQLQVRDVMLRQKVLCYFPEEMLPDAFDKFRKRVEVSGVIHYRKNGTPVSIAVEQIDLLPEDEALPTAEDVRGILKISA
jgi:hypothetical protein